MKVGGDISSVHVTVRDVVEVLLQPSFAVNVLVCDRLHPALWIEPSLWVIVADPQASFAVAVPKAVEISEAAGLHPNGTFEYDPVNVGGALSANHTTVLDTVDVLLHASLAVKVLFCDQLQPALWGVPSTEVIVTGPHASAALAVPNPLVISDAAGLQPRSRAK